MYNIFRAVFGDAARLISITLGLAALLLIVFLHESILTPLFGQGASGTIIAVLIVGGIVVGLVSMVRSWTRNDKLKQDTEETKRALASAHDRIAKMQARK